jgi:hypothetical protein
MAPSAFEVSLMASMPPNAAPSVGSSEFNERGGKLLQQLSFIAIKSFMISAWQEL